MVVLDVQMEENVLMVWVIATRASVSRAGRGTCVRSTLMSVRMTPASMTVTAWTWWVTSCAYVPSHGLGPCVMRGWSSAQTTPVSMTLSVSLRRTHSGNFIEVDDDMILTQQSFTGATVFLTIMDGDASTGEEII